MHDQRITLDAADCEGIYDQICISVTINLRWEAPIALPRSRSPHNAYASPSNYWHYNDRVLLSRHFTKLQYKQYCIPAGVTQYKISRKSCVLCGLVYSVLLQNKVLSAEHWCGGRRTCHTCSYGPMYGRVCVYTEAAWTGFGWHNCIQI